MAKLKEKQTGFVWDADLRANGDADLRRVGGGTNYHKVVSKTQLTAGYESVADTKEGEQK